jgi:hypothetical protein
LCSSKITHEKKLYADLLNILLNKQLTLTQDNQANDCFYETYYHQDLFKFLFQSILHAMSDHTENGVLENQVPLFLTLLNAIKPTQTLDVLCNASVVQKNIKGTVLWVTLIQLYKNITAPSAGDKNQRTNETLITFLCSMIEKLLSDSVSSEALILLLGAQKALSIANQDYRINTLWIMLPLIRHIECENKMITPLPTLLFKLLAKLFLNPISSDKLWQLLSPAAPLYVGMQINVFHQIAAVLWMTNKQIITMFCSFKKIDQDALQTSLALTKLLTSLIQQVRVLLVVSSGTLRIERNVIGDSAAPQEFLIESIYHSRRHLFTYCLSILKRCSYFICDKDLTAIKEVETAVQIMEQISHVMEWITQLGDATSVVDLLFEKFDGGSQTYADLLTLMVDRLNGLQNKASSRKPILECALYNLIKSVKFLECKIATSSDVFIPPVAMRLFATTGKIMDRYAAKPVPLVFQEPERVNQEFTEPLAENRLRSPRHGAAFFRNNLSGEKEKEEDVTQARAKR